MASSIEQASEANMKGNSRLLLREPTLLSDPEKKRVNGFHIFLATVCIPPYKQSSPTGRKYANKLWEEMSLKDRVYYDFLADHFNSENPNHGFDFVKYQTNDKNLKKISHSKKKLLDNSSSKPSALETLKSYTSKECEIPKINTENKHKINSSKNVKIYPTPTMNKSFYKRKIKSFSKMIQLKSKPTYIKATNKLATIPENPKVVLQAIQIQNTLEIIEGQATPVINILVESKDSKEIMKTIEAFKQFWKVSPRTNHARAINNAVMEWNTMSQDERQTFLNLDVNDIDPSVIGKQMTI